MDRPDADAPQLTEQECLALIDSEGWSAEGLLEYRLGENLRAEFDRVDRAMVKFLAKVKKHFPDANYYTSGGVGFSLLLGQSHNLHDQPQQQLSCYLGAAQVGGGDW